MYVFGFVRSGQRDKTKGNRAGVVRPAGRFDNGGFVAANSKAELDSMAVTVAGNDDRLLLMALYDNLGKGASGAALECMNIVMGLPPEYGLDL